jgi:nucleoside phosphorylase
VGWEDAPELVVKYLRRRKLLHPLKLQLSTKGAAHVESLRDQHGNIEVPADEALGGPKVVPCATDDYVLGDPVIWSNLETLQRKVLALDNEAYGVLRTCQDKGVTRVVIKGVADFGDGDKGDWFHSYSAEASAELLIRILESGAAH